MAIKFVIDNKGTFSHLDRLSDIPDQLAVEAGQYFRDITPFKTGNARTNTYTTGDTIRAAYNYASRLDEGSSKQAPNGMSEPTVAFIDKRLKQLVEKK